MDALRPPANCCTNTNLSFSTSAQPHAVLSFWSSVIANHSVTLLTMYSLISSLFFLRKWGLMQLFCMSVPPHSSWISSSSLNKFSRRMEFLRILVKLNGIQQLRVLRPKSVPPLKRKVRTSFSLLFLPLTKQLIGVHTPWPGRHILALSHLQYQLCLPSLMDGWYKNWRDRDLWK